MLIGHFHALVQVYRVISVIPITDWDYLVLIEVVLASLKEKNLLQQREVAVQVWKDSPRQCQE